MRTLLFWLALPWLLPQALRVRRRAPRFAPPPGEPRGILPGDPSLRVVGIGDSIIAGVGAHHMQAALLPRMVVMLADHLGVGIRWESLGKIGATTRGVTERLLPRLTTQPVDLFVVSVGVNDITSMTTLATWRRDLDRLLDGLRAHSPAAWVVMAGIPPLQHFPLLPQPLRWVIGLRGKRFAQALADAVQDRSRCIAVPLDFAPGREQFSADGFHPSHDAYAEFAAAMVAATLPGLAQDRDCL